MVGLLPGSGPLAFESALLCSFRRFDTLEVIKAFADARGRSTTRQFHFSEGFEVEVANSLRDTLRLSFFLHSSLNHGSLDQGILADGGLSLLAMAAPRLPSPYLPIVYFFLLRLPWPTKSDALTFLVVARPEAALVDAGISKSHTLVPLISSTRVILT